MIRQIGLASVYVSDQDKALEFSVGKLGFEAINSQSQEGFRWIEVASPGAETGMTLAQRQTLHIS